MYIKRDSVYFNSATLKLFISSYYYTNSTSLKEQIIRHILSEVCISNVCKIASMGYIIVTKNHSFWLMVDLLMIVFGLHFSVVPVEAPFYTLRVFPDVKVSHWVS